jgi:hypothetical protein
MRHEPAPGLLHDLTPDERFRELASLLALGLRALRDRAASSPDLGTISALEPAADSCPNSLEVPAETRLSVPTG